jgi:hypothetical protein
MADDYDDPELEVTIRSRADTSGIDDARKSVEELRDAAGERSGGLAHSLRELSGTSRHTREIFRGLEGAAMGGVRGLGEMVRGFRALIIISEEAISATGIGGIIALLAGAGLGAMLAFGKSTHEAAGELDKASSSADELKASIEAATKAMDNAFKPLIEDAKALVSEMEKLDKMQKESDARADKLEAAQFKGKIAQLDLDEQTSIMALGTDPKKLDVEAVRGSFALKKKNAQLDEESRQSKNTVSEAEAAAKRGTNLAAEASGKEYEDYQVLRDAQAAADDAKRKAGTLNTFAIEAAQRGDKGAEAAQEAARVASRDAFAKQAAVKTAQEKFDATKAETGKVITGSEEADRKLRDAQDLDAANQKRIATEREIAANEKAAKDQEQAATALKEAAAALKAAAHAKEETDKKEARDEAKADKVPKETKAEAKAADAAEEHRDAKAEAAVERMSRGAEHLESAVAKHAEKTAASHEATVEHLEKSSRILDRTNRQLVNAGSYNTSP